MSALPTHNPFFPDSTAQGRNSSPRQRHELEAQGVPSPWHGIRQHKAVGDACDVVAAQALCATAAARWWPSCAARCCYGGRSARATTTGRCTCCVSACLAPRRPRWRLLRSEAARMRSGAAAHDGSVIVCWKHSRAELSSDQSSSLRRQIGTPGTKSELVSVPTVNAARWPSGPAGCVPS